MIVLDQTLAGEYRVAALRDLARRDALARQAAPSPLRRIARRFSR